MECGRRIPLFILSFICFGTSLGLLIWTLIDMGYYGVSSSSAPYIICIIAIIIVGIVFILTIYASCCGGPCSLMCLGTMLVIMAIILLVFVIVVLVMIDPIMEQLYLYWQQTSDTSQLAVIQEQLGCCGFHNSSDYPINNCDVQLEGCATLIEDTLDTYGVIIAVVFGILIIFLGIAAALAFLESNRPNEASRDTL